MDPFTKIQKEYQEVYNQLSDKFNLEQQFDYYLHTTGMLKEIKDNPKYKHQYHEMNKAFIAGVSAVITYIQGTDRTPNPLLSVDINDREALLEFILTRMKTAGENTIEFWKTEAVNLLSGG